MQTFTAPIVGMFFRPPAKTLLKYLPAESSLTLQRELENPYDPNAVMVFCDVADIPAEFHEDLNAEAEPFGFSIEEILAQDQWHLGYIAKEYAAHLAPLLDKNPPDSVYLFFNIENKPMAKITIELEE